MVKKNCFFSENKYCNKIKQNLTKNVFLNFFFAEVVENSIYGQICKKNITFSKKKFEKFSGNGRIFGNFLQSHF